MMTRNKPKLVTLSTCLWSCMWLHIGKCIYLNGQLSENVLTRDIKFLPYSQMFLFHLLNFVIISHHKTSSFRWNL